MLNILNKPKPLVLCVLDGWGVAPDSRGNAVTRANCVNFNRLWFSFPHTLLKSSGSAVGLPEGQVGNSEVGHLNLGAGRIVFQDVMRINAAIANGNFFENEAYIGAIEHVKKYNSRIHVMGLIGSGIVHSEINHLWALLYLFQREKLDSPRVKIHIFTDGRDSPPASAKAYVHEIESRLIKENLGQIASVCGRYFAMDRDNRWDRTAKAYFGLLGQSLKTALSADAAIANSYAEGKTDEFIEPIIILGNDSKPIGPIEENDAVIFFNYRSDRVRQLTRAFVLEKLEKIKASSGETIETFNRGLKIKNLFFVTTTEYEKGLPVSDIAFKPDPVLLPLSRIIAERHLHQLHIAETEKYAHVTYFFNGGREVPFNGEKRILINSQKVASYDLKPEMSTPSITKEVIRHIASRVYDFIIVNFANADMVSHTGNFEAAVLGIKCIDDHLGPLVKSVLSIGGGVIVTADHGNAEEMINLKTGQADTEHNSNSVPCLLIFKDFQNNSVQLPLGILADVAPTILDILRIPKPSQMTGRSLIS